MHECWSSALTVSFYLSAHIEQLLADIDPPFVNLLEVPDGTLTGLCRARTDRQAWMGNTLINAYFLNDANGVSDMKFSYHI